VLDLHGAGLPGRDGFFIIKGNDDGGMSDRILAALKSEVLVDPPGARGQPTAMGPYVFDGLGRAFSHNVGSLKSFGQDSGARYSYTMEAPTRFEPARQVKGLVRMV